ELGWGDDDDSPALHNPRYWFEQAVKARPEHANAYTKYAWGLLLRWGGSIRAELAFARECLETQRFDTNIPHVVVAVINNVMRDVDDEPGMLRVLAPGMMKMLDQSYTQYLERAADPRQKQSLQQQRLYWAWKLDLP